MRDIIFLIYLNRSGSTLLANQASGHPAICVCPEAHRPIRRLLGDLEPRVTLTRRIERMAAEVSSDPKLRSWGLNGDSLLKHMASANDDVDALYRLLDHYADTHMPGARQVMVKGLFLLTLLRRHGIAGLQREGRNVRAIFLFRDARSIMSSQFRSVSSTSGKVMQGSAFALAMRWRSYLNIAKPFRRHANCLFVRYEDWICSNLEEQRRLFDFLNLSYDAGGDGTLSARIPESQRHLHAKIGDEPDLSRVEAWRSELAPRHRTIIEGIAGAQLTALDYDVAERVSVSKLAWHTLPDAWLWISKKLWHG